MISKVQQTPQQQTPDLIEVAQAKQAEAREDRDRAETHASDAFTHVAGAALNTLIAGADTVEGTADVAGAGAHLVTSAQLAVAGAAEWAGEKVVDFFAGGIRAVAGRDDCDAPSQHPESPRLSAQLFGAAANQWHRTGDSLRAAWHAFGEAGTHLEGAVANLGLAAGHTGLALEDAAEAVQDEAAAGVAVAESD
ncbi:MAG: hypothetical protein IPJ65_26380 [Archangiaceae bacterium]|nr:hypothetical protein [Archangiaceae bacterium]